MSRGFWQGGFLSRGFLSGGLCLGGFCPGVFCPDTINFVSLECCRMFSSEAWEYRLYTERKSVSENRIIGNVHCMVFSFKRNMIKMLL